MPLFFAVTPKGVEAVTSSEIEGLGGANLDADSGGVRFEGDLSLLYRANLYLRTATRVVMPIREFSSANVPMLYDQVRRIKWEQYFPGSETLAVDAHISGTSEHRKGLDHSHFAALKIKDAIVDRIRETTGSRPDVDTSDPDIRVHAFIRGTKCTISLDSSGRSLHERGYRSGGSDAPLKETLAAAIVMISGWSPDRPMLDPMCGSGTILIEAAMMAMGIPPGFKRKDFGFMHWPDFDKRLWSGIVSEAEDSVRRGAACGLFGFDANPESIKAAKKNAIAAGVGGAIKFESRSLQSLENPSETPGTLIVNPPYGMRLVEGGDAKLEALYKTLGDTFKQKLKGWTAHIFTGNPGMAKHVGLRTSKRTILYNGPIECRLLKYDMY